MGKSGKARKRQRLLTGTVEIAAESSSIGDDNNDRDDLNKRVEITIEVLNLFARNKNEYFSKPMKILRAELFPLIQLQRNCHFELEQTLPVASPEEIALTLAPSNILTAVRTARHFAQNHGFRMLPFINCELMINSPIFFSPLSHCIFLDIFKNGHSKYFRKALHPLVSYHFAKAKATDNIESISNSISQAFRIRDWNVALCALRAFAATSSEVPKLGSLQRWVCPHIYVCNPQ